MRRIVAIALIVLATAADAATVDRTAEMTNEVLDLFALEPICGYSIDKAKLDIYMLGTHMFWGEPVSHGEIEDLRVRAAGTIGNDAYQKAKKCRSVNENFGPSGQRARGIAH